MGAKMAETASFTPLLGAGFLSPFYDAAIRLATREGRGRSPVGSPAANQGAISVKHVRAAAFAALLAAAWPSAAMAHDFFLLPTQFDGAGNFEVHATVGAAFPATDTVVAPERIAELRASEGASIAIAGPGDQSLRLALTPSRPGAHAAGVRTLPREVEYEGDRIALIMEEYEVSAEAQQAVAALGAPRVLRATSERFAKTIVCSDTCAGAAAHEAFGYPLEFVADASGANRFRLLFNGRPLANYPIAIAINGARAHARTDAEGRVTADGPGPIMLFAAHMRPPADAGGRFSMLLTSLTVSGR